MSQRLSTQPNSSRFLLRRVRSEVRPRTCALAAILVLEFALAAVIAQRRRMNQLIAPVASLIGVPVLSA